MKNRIKYFSVFLNICYWIYPFWHIGKLVVYISFNKVVYRRCFCDIQKILIFVSRNTHKKFNFIDEACQDSIRPRWSQCSRVFQINISWDHLSFLCSSSVRIADDNNMNIHFKETLTYYEIILLWITL